MLQLEARRSPCGATQRQSFSSIYQHMGTKPLPVLDVPKAEVQPEKHIFSHTVWDTPGSNPRLLPGSLTSPWHYIVSGPFSHSLPTVSQIPPPPTTAPDPPRRSRQLVGAPPKGTGWTILSYHQGQPVWFDTKAWYTPMKRPAAPAGIPQCYWETYQEVLRYHCIQMPPPPSFVDPQNRTRW